MSVQEGHQATDRLTVDIVDLRRPEKQQYKVIASTEESDEENDNHSLLGLGEQRSRDHRVFSIELPYKERDNKNETDHKRHNVVRASPFILSSVSIAINLI